MRREPASRSHSRVQAQFVELMRPYCTPSHEVHTGWGWHVGPEPDFEPDIMVRDRSSPDADVLRRPAPLLVVEVSSPSTRDVDCGLKRRSYASGGAPWDWVVDFRRLEVVVFENMEAEFVEVQRITNPTAALGPFPVVIDPGNFADR